MNLDDSPFGPSDANHKNEKAITEIVDISTLMPAFSFHQDPRETRTIIGHKGSGKTHALRFLEAKSNRENFAVLSKFSSDIATANIVIGLKTLAGGGRYPIWEKIWRCAVTVSALSRFVGRNADDDARRAVEESSVSVKDLVERWPEYVFSDYSFMDPTRAISFIFDKTKNPAALLSYVSNPALSELELELSRIMQHSTPIHFLLDGLDEYEISDPATWSHIQLGLFWFCFHESTTTRSPLRRVFVTAALRETVLIEAQKSPHSDRFSYGSSIMILSWGHQAAERFFRDRLKKIRQRHFWKAEPKLDSRRPEIQWLGLTQISPRDNGDVEEIANYILRHTRCTPRDIIDIGNEVAKTLNHANVESKRNPKTIEAAVSRASHFIAKQIISNTAQELARSPLFEESEEISSFRMNSFVGPVEYFYTFVLSILSRNKCEVISPDELDSAIRGHLLESSTGYADDSRISYVREAFWRNGAIGVTKRRYRNEGWQFAWSDVTRPEMTMPSDLDEVGLHPSMFDIMRIGRHPHGPAY